MSSLRWVLVTFGLPAAYIAVLYLATRPEKPVYAFAGHTVLTVTEKGGPAILHAPDAVYPAQALRDRVEGNVALQVTIAGDGTVAQAVAVSGPAVLRQAALDNVRQWQFEPKAQQTPIDISFSLRSVTRSFVPPQPLHRIAPSNPGREHGAVRVVVMVDPEGRVEFAHPISGPETLRPAALAAVRQWIFRPKVRNGKVEHGTAVVDIPFFEF